MKITVLNYSGKKNYTTTKDIQQSGHKLVPLASDPDIIIINPPNGTNPNYHYKIPLKWTPNLKDDLVFISAYNYPTEYRMVSTVTETGVIVFQEYMSIEDVQDYYNNEWKGIRTVKVSLAKPAWPSFDDNIEITNKIFEL